MGVAHTLSRTFFWSDNILWKNDITERQVTIFLSGKDSIVNAPLVYAYLRDGAEEGQQKVKHFEPPVDGGRLNVVFCDNLDHGQIFDLTIWRMRLLDEVLAQARVREDER
jgi:hypothetical protein